MTGDIDVSRFDIRMIDLHSGSRSNSVRQFKISVEDAGGADRRAKEESDELDQPANNKSRRYKQPSKLS